ncbi:MAG: M23 family metallopeptidase, partial [Gallionellaceae bacterium]|nr:M23 family metallopeptidase [Gallionellaceae bacterium]
MPTRHCPLAALLTRAGLFGLILAASAGHAGAVGPAAEQATPVIQAVAFGLTAAATANETGPGDQSPLFAASDAVGLPEELAIQLSELFAEEIDFHRDLSRGYLCTLVYEMYYPGGMPEAGRILAARFVTPDRQAEAYLFQDEPGPAAYYDARGVDVNKTLRLVDPDREPWLKALSGAAMVSAFRRSPLEFSRITSLPAALRYHPILKEWRAHRGTDYGAATGTGVRATAAGLVTYVGVRGNYGKLIELRHFDRYTTRYGHLSAYAPGLAVGDAIVKGQVIGKVGMTGLATGPHLHYELRSDPGASPPDR